MIYNYKWIKRRDCFQGVNFEDQIILQEHLGDNPMVKNAKAPLLKVKKGATVKSYAGHIILVISF